MAIIVTGTPGTGKTTIAKQIASRYNLKYIDINKVIRNNKLTIKIDKKRKTKIVDEKKLARLLIGIIKKNRKIVIDGHLSHFIPSKYIDLCIVTKCDIRRLKRRLQKRGYDKRKIDENLEAEIFDVIYIEAKEAYHNIFIVDTSNNKLDYLPYLRSLLENSSMQ